jgi:hypothetical protein
LKIPFLLCVILALGVNLAASEPTRRDLAKSPLPPEVPDQAPAVVAPRENPLARSPATRVATGPYVSVQVNVDGQGLNIVGDAANEPSISVNPVNPNNMVIGWRQFNSVTSNFRQAGWGYTFDKGQSWTFPGVLTPGTFRSDPVLDVDSSGTFYYQSLKSSFLLDVFKSFDGGVTWSDPVPSFGGDKNWLVVDRSGGIGDGNLYGIWQRFFACCGTNVVTRSTDAGASFQSPVPAAFWPTFGTLAVGPDGRVFATGIDGTDGQDFSQFVIASSADARIPEVLPTFSTGRKINLGGSMALGGGPNPGGLLGQGNVATDHSHGPTRGYVYVLASVTPFAVLDDLDVYITYSPDNGGKWSLPVRVNDDPPGANYQWLAAHAVAPSGRIDAIWFDTRDSGLTNVSRLYYAYSWNAGRTWSANVAVSPPFDSWVGWPQQNKMGDYITLVSDENGADVAYAATFNGEQDVYYVRLFPDCNGNGESDLADLEADASLDCNSNHLPDECEATPVCPGAGSVPGGGSVAGTPLTVEKGPGDSLSLAWGASCVPVDADYVVYEGTLGSFASHAPKTCSTEGARSWALTPSLDGAYYLVVPRHADREGSYGTDGAGAERPPASQACVPQQVRACGG